MQRAPGQTLLALARRVLSRTEIDRIVEPAIADLQHEWSASTGAPLVVRFAIRIRAYVAALLVVGRHILAGTVRGSLISPPWPLVRQILLASLLFVVPSAALQAFTASPRMDEPWLLRMTDALLVFGRFSPYMWVYFLDRRVLAKRGISEPRASDIAKLTAVVCVVLLAWTGWIAPLVRQHYFADLDPGSQIMMSPRDWMLPDLAWRVLTSPAQPNLIIELHQRLLALAFIPSLGMLCWSTIRRSRRNAIGTAAGFHLLSFSLLGVIFLAFSLAFSNAFGRVAADWLGVVAVTIGALCVLWIVRRDECSAQLTEAGA